MGSLWSFVIGGCMLALVLLTAVAALWVLLAFYKAPNNNPVAATNPGVTDGPPVSVGGLTYWMSRFSWSPFWKVIWWFLLIVLSIAMAWYLLNLFGVVPSSGSAISKYDDTQTILLLGLAALIGLIIWNRRAIFEAPATGTAVSISLPAKGSLAAQILTSMLVFALLLFALWEVSPNAELFTTWEGWATIFMYCVAMIATALVALNLKGWAKVAPAIALFIFFWLTGFHTWMLLNSDGVFEQRTHIAESLSRMFSSSRNGASSTGSFQEVTLAPNIISDINPNGARKLQIKHPNQCIYLRRAQWTRDTQWYGPFCDNGKGGNAPTDIEFATTATTGNAIILVRSY